MLTDYWDEATRLVGKVEGSTFTDASLINDSTYYYVVSMVSGGVESPDSAPVSGKSALPNL